MPVPEAEAVIGGFSPDATFLATQVDYPRGDAADTVSSSLTTLAGYLAPDVPSANGGVDLVDSVFQFTGFINITSALDSNPGGDIDVEFSVGSDDGFNLLIGGVSVTSFSGLRGFSHSFGTASFDSPGLYPIDLYYYENSGGTGIELKWQIPGQFTVVPTSSLYTAASASVPDAGATAVLLGLGLAGLAFARRKLSA